MPELPEVETVVRGLKKEMLNCKITSIASNYQRIVWSGFLQFKKELCNSTIKSIQRHGKYIFLLLASKKMVVVHLRMTGQLFFIDKEKKIDKHTHLEISFSKKKYKVVYRDIRKFGGFELVPHCNVAAYVKQKQLGPDALEISEKQFKERLLRRAINLKAALLNQQVVAGIGNIYADEILFREKLSPLMNPKQLTSKKISSLLKRIKQVLRAAILKKGTTFSDYVTSYGKQGNFQLLLQAYKQKGKPCRHCGTKIIKIKVAGRGTHICPQCQKL